MSRLNRENILGYFCGLTGITTQDDPYQAMIENAAKYIEKQLKFNELTQPQKERCEYTAAVCAVYEYVLSKNLRERIVVTQDGQAVSHYNSDTVSVAYELRKAALEAIDDLTDNGFAFAATGGV